MNHLRMWLVTTGLLIILGACAKFEIRQLPIPPSLDLDFTNGILPGGLTFTRNSPGTFYDKDGLLKTATAHVPRFDYDPLALTMRGLLVEEERTNFITYSEQLDKWSTSGIELLTNNVAAPSGPVSAELIIPTTNAVDHLVSSNGPVALTDTVYTVSCFFKPQKYTVLGLFLQDASAGGLTEKAGYIFDVQNNRTLAVSRASLGKPFKPVIEKISNGYYRCSVCIKTARSASLKFCIQVRPDFESSSVYSGDGASGGYVWGAQLELGSFPTSYIPTVTAAETRNTDLCLVNNVSTWFNPLQGTWIAETVLGRRLIARIVGYDWPGNFIGISPRSQTTTESWNGHFNVIKAGTRSTGIVRHAMSYTSTNRKLTREGLVPVTSNTPIGEVNQVAIGANANGTNVLNAHVRRVTYYSSQQPDAILQQLTQ